MWLMGCISYWGCKKFRLNSWFLWFFIQVVFNFLFLAKMVKLVTNDFRARRCTHFTAKFLDDYTLAVLIGVFLFSYPVGLP